MSLISESRFVGGAVGPDLDAPPDGFEFITHDGETVTHDGVPVIVPTGG